MPVTVFFLEERAEGDPRPAFWRRDASLEYHLILLSSPRPSCLSRQRIPWKDSAHASAKSTVSRLEEG